MEDAKSVAELIADDLATYPDNSLVETFMSGLQDFLDSPARVRHRFNSISIHSPSVYTVLILAANPRTAWSRHP